MKIKTVDFDRWYDYDPDFLLEVVFSHYGKNASVLTEDERRVHIEHLFLKLAKKELIVEYADGLGWSAFDGIDFSDVGKAFSDLFTVAGGTLSKFWQTAKTSLTAVAGLFLSLFVPVEKEFWKELRKQRKESFAKIESGEYSEAMKRIDKTIADSDLTKFAFMANPKAFLAVKVAQYLDQMPEAAEWAKAKIDEKKEWVKKAAAAVAAGGVTASILGASPTDRERSAEIATYFGDVVNHNKDLAAFSQAAAGTREKAIQVFTQSFNEAEQQADKIAKAKSLDEIVAILAKTSSGASAAFKKAINDPKLNELRKKAESESDPKKKLEILNGILKMSKVSLIEAITSSIAEDRAKISALNDSGVNSLYTNVMSRLKTIRDSVK